MKIPQDEGISPNCLHYLQTIITESLIFNLLTALMEVLWPLRGFCANEVIFSWNLITRQIDVAVFAEVQTLWLTSLFSTWVTGTLTPVSVLQETRRPGAHRSVMLLSINRRAIVPSAADENNLPSQAISRSDPGKPRIEGRVKLQSAQSYITSWAYVNATKKINRVQNVESQTWAF